MARLKPLIEACGPGAADRTAGDRPLRAIRCYNYRTQLTVAGKLVVEGLEAGQSVVLVLDRNAEEAIGTLETLGFALRPDSTAPVWRCSSPQASTSMRSGRSATEPQRWPKLSMTSVELLA